jgi:hypothetical protein
LGTSVLYGPRRSVELHLIACCNEAIQ